MVKHKITVEQEEKEEDPMNKPKRLKQVVGNRGTPSGVNERKKPASRGAHGTASTAKTSPAGASPSKVGPDPRGRR